MISKQVSNFEGLVISVSQYGEDSAIVSFATDSGLVPLLARGIYKPKSQLKPLLIVGNLLKIDYKHTEKGLYIASSLLVIFDASEAMSNYQESVFLLLLSELSMTLYKFGDSYPYKEASTLISSLLNKGDCLSTTLLLLGTFYRSLGINENVNSCIGCGKKEDIVAYSLQEGGFLCSKCLEGYKNVEPCSTLELYVLKFSFMPINQVYLSKTVPQKEGLKILNGLLNNLVDYFDLHPIKTLPVFISALTN